MTRKAIPYIFIAVLAIAVVFARTCRNSDGDQSTTNGSDVKRDHGFDRRTSYLEYTKHAQCRMECREIDSSEVEEIMRTGMINYRKSDMNAHPCPTYALEGMTHDNQHVRIVFAQCDHETKVVTTIDLEHEWECHCPGDESR
jgi:hypothetical protein